MRSLFLALLTAGLFVQTPQQPPEAYPGQHQHKEPPAGFYCSATAKDKAHKCDCKHMAMATPEDPQCCEAEVQETPKCTVYCFKAKCLCPIVCSTMSEHNHKP